MRVEAAIGAILVICSTASIAWSGPVTVEVSPSSSTLTVGDTVTATFTFDPSQLAYPPEAQALIYNASIYFDERYFAFVSWSGISVDAGDWLYFDVGTTLGHPHDGFSIFQYTDDSPFNGGFTFSETFMAIRGTPETDVLTRFEAPASASYQVFGVVRTLVNVGAPEFFEITPHVPEPGLLALSSIAFAALGARRARKSRRS